MIDHATQLQGHSIVMNPVTLKLGNMIDHVTLKLGGVIDPVTLKFQML